MSRATLNLGSSPEFDIVRGVPACHFCPHSTDDRFALTAQAPDGQWQRAVEPTCARCRALLRRAGADGLTLKTTGERWYLGHGQGLYDAPQGHY